MMIHLITSDGLVIHLPSVPSKNGVDIWKEFKELVEYPLNPRSGAPKI